MPSPGDGAVQPGEGWDGAVFRYLGVMLAMWAGLGSTVLQRYSLGPAICHCRDKEPEAQAPVTDTRVLPVDGN